jgi:dTDP-glucose 4,6-dehydratase
MGRHILMLSMAATGHVMPSVGLAAELARRGHRVSFVTTDQFAGPLEAAGVEVVRYTSTMPASSTMENVNPFSELISALRENSAIADAVKARFADTPPDLITYDSTAFLAGRVLSRNRQLPAVMLSATFASGPLYSVTAAITERSPKGESSDEPSLAEYFFGLGNLVSAHGPNLRVTDDLFGAWEGLTVVTIPREFQIAGDSFGELWAFVGPCLDDRAYQGQWQPPNEDPVLLVSFGSSNYKGQRGFLETCVSAFTGLAWHVVMSTGPDLDPAELGPLPPNMEAYRQVPQIAILKRAKVFISHAGMGGNMEALSLGVPILGFPQLPECDISADRIVELGLGRKGTLDISADELRATVLDLAADASTAHALTQMREHIKKAGGAPRAADEVESYMLRADRKCSLQIRSMRQPRRSAGSATTNLGAAMNHPCEGIMASSPAISPYAQVSALNVLDAYVFTPFTFPDRRGLFAASFQQHAFAEAVGRNPPVAQINYNVSRYGALRGVHFTETPPGQAKYVLCTWGALLDVVVDVRVGSPTFGQWDAIRLDAGKGQAVYLAEGLGHACMALAEDTVMTYHLCSAAYDPAAERGIDPLDPTLALPWPNDHEHLLSAQDTAAPTLERARREGLLPRYDECVRHYRSVRKNDRIGAQGLCPQLSPRGWQFLLRSARHVCSRGMCAMKVLITGGAGFIGSNYVRAVLRGAYPSFQPAEVVVLDKLTYAGNLANLAPVANDRRLRVTHSDICDSWIVKREMAGTDLVVHFAAESHVDRSIVTSDEFVRTNVQGTHTLLQAALDAGVPRFVHVSTDEVYGSIEKGSWREDDPVAPNSLYSATKASADMIARAFHVTHGLPVLITRCSNNYGPYQNPEKMIPLFLTNLMDGYPVPLYGDGGNVREWLHVDDHCRGIQLVAERGQVGEVYHIGGSTELSNWELTERLLALTGRDVSLVHPVADRKGHDRRYSLDISKITKELGYSPTVGISEGLSRTAAWYRDNRTWWEPLKPNLVGTS